MYIETTKRTRFRHQFVSNQDVTLATPLARGPNPIHAQPYLGQAILEIGVCYEAEEAKPGQ